MYEKFSELIFESGYYMAVEVVPQVKYTVKHIRPEKREGWEKVEFNIDVLGFGEEYLCECGLSEHMGMVCPHIFRVLIQFGVQKIPKKHILKRWTVNARDVLPDHLQHYQKDKAALHSQTFRHSSLYLTALNVVEMGDSNPEAHEIAMRFLLQAEAALKEVAAIKDGLGLADQLRVQHPTEQTCVVQEQTREAKLNMLPPERIKKRGRPSICRDKPAYEVRRKRARFYPPNQGSDTIYDQADVSNGEPPSKRKREITCSRCRLKGHNRTACFGPAPSEFPDTQINVPPSLPFPWSRLHSSDLQLAL